MATFRRCLFIATVATLFLFKVAVAKESSIRAAENDHRALVVQRPAYWKTYLAVFTPKRLKTCAKKVVAPVNGSKCPIKPAGWYSCMFGEQQCAAVTSALPGLGSITGAKLGVVHPKTRCDCVDGKWKCFEWTVCAASVTKAPATAALTKAPATVALTKAPATVVLTKAPATTTLTKAPATAALTKAPATAALTKAPVITSVVDAPASGNDALCPAVLPNSRDLVPAGLKVGTSCEYGEICCCASCDTKIHCVNNNGIFQCLTFAIKCTATCPPQTTSFVPVPRIDPPILLAPPVQATVDSCPTEQGFMAKGTVCSTDLRCAYGKESCCGKTYDQLICVCSQGDSSFGCFHTDACMQPICNTPQPLTLDVANVSFP
jgi:hypothetical protein